MIVEIVEISWGSKEYQHAFDLRNHVLRKPLGLDLMNDDLTTEKTGIHIGAKLNHQIHGVCVIEPLDKQRLKVRQVAVSEEFRGQGIGQELLKRVETYGLMRGNTVIELDARKNAWHFYQRLGYQFQGEEYLKFNTVWHRKMIKELR